MASLGLTFDPNTVEPGGMFEDLAPGPYPAEVHNTEVKLTNSGTGKKLVIEWRVTEGERANSRIWQNINVENDSQSAQEIGQKQLSAVSRALGLDYAFDDSQELHGRVAIIVVGMSKYDVNKIDPKTGQPYPARPEVKNVKPYQAGAPAPQAQQRQAPAQNTGTAQNRPAGAAPAQRQAAAPAQATGPRPAGSRPWGKGQRATG